MEACLNLTSFKLDIDEDIYGSRSPRGSYKLCARVWNRNKQNCAFKSKSCRDHMSNTTTLEMVTLNVSFERQVMRHPAG